MIFLHDEVGHNKPVIEGNWAVNISVIPCFHGLIEVKILPDRCRILNAWALVEICRVTSNGGDD